MPRRFTAINFPPEIKDELSSYLEGIKWPKKRVSPVKPENYHLTLRFWGEKRPIHVNADRYAPFKLRINSIGLFPGQKRPRYIVAFLEEEKILKKIASDLGEERELRPHITLARIRKKVDEKHLRQLNKIDFRPIEIYVKKIDLMSSQLDEDGPVYAIEKEYFL